MNFTDLTTLLALKKRKNTFNKKETFVSSVHTECIQNEGKDDIDHDCEQKEENDENKSNSWEGKKIEKQKESYLLLEHSHWIKEWIE